MHLSAIDFYHLSRNSIMQNMFDAFEAYNDAGAYQYAKALLNQCGTDTHCEAAYWMLATLAETL